MSCELECRKTADGVEFRCVERGKAIPVDSWALQDVIFTARRSRAHTGVLQRLLDESAAAVDGDTVYVPNATVANLEEDQLRALGLPSLSDVSVELSANGPLTDPEFRVSCRFMHANGRPVVSPRREGCFLIVGEQERVLPHPLYDLLEAIDRFHAAVPANIEERFVAWADVAERLPEDALVDDYLRSVRILVPASFTLDLRANQAGEVDFDPLLGRQIPNDDILDEDKRFERVLPEARQVDFARRFRGLNNVRRRYSAGANCFVILPERVRRGLEVVKRAQSGSPLERAEFARNPQLHLREALDPQRTDPSFEDLFHDGDYGARVRGVGVWQPKVVPWIKKGPNPWLPPEECGLRVDDAFVSIDATQIDQIVAEVRSAIDRGEATVQIADSAVPANEETLASLAHLKAASAPLEDPTSPAEPEAEAAPAGPREVLSLLVLDNLGDVEFEGRSRLRDGEVGGIPTLMRSRLLPHQIEALDWLQDLWCDGRPGALLADDMGLGKTLEALAFLSWLKENEERSGRRLPVLIVAPTGLLKNWQDEHDKHLFAPGLGGVLEAHGPGLARIRAASAPEADSGVPSLNVRRLESAAWVMTTYETLRDYAPSFGLVRWSAAVFDEAQKIKNPAARMTDAAKGVNAEFTLALTGTPVENRLADLWCIVDAVQPGRLGSLREFSSKYESDSVEDAIPALSRLREMVAGGDRPRVMLRRLKEDHLEGLPEKELVPLVRDMPAKQAEAYDALIQRARGGASVLEVLHGLRSVSLHPYKRQDEDDEEYIRDSARLQTAFEILDGIASAGQKALLFIESREMQGYLAEILQRRYRLTAPPLIINGSVAGFSRKSRVDVFQGRPGFDVMLISPKAGGVGLTLTAANHVIHLSRWWNPAVEDQCTDRAYRIGQDRKVFVYLPVARHPVFADHSFDVTLNSLLERKRGLNRSVLAPPGLTKEDQSALYDATILGKAPSPVVVPVPVPSRPRGGGSEASRGEGAGRALVPQAPSREPVAEPDPEWIVAVLSSAEYRRQRESAGRTAPDDERVRLILRVLHLHGGTMTRPALATRLGLPLPRVQGAVNGLRRLLNFEGYEVVRIDEASDSIAINISLLMAQLGDR